MEIKQRRMDVRNERKGKEERMVKSQGVGKKRKGGRNGKKERCRQGKKR